MKAAAEQRWEVAALDRADDQAIAELAARAFEGIYRRQFHDEWQINHRLPVEVRAFRRMEGWSVFLLLTPWMMARLFVADHDPGLPVPDEWLAENRREASYTVIGPAVTLTLLGQPQQAHLNYQQELGHYLIQPLVQAMEPFESADAVFAAWNEVIQTRNRIMEEQKRDCGWQKEVSRREFFARLVKGRQEP